MQWAYGQVGVALARVADDQCRTGAPVARADLLAGDVVCFDDGTGYISHVGLYAGDDRFLHAPHTGAVIGYNALSEPYYSARFAGARRVTADRAARAAANMCHGRGRDDRDAGASRTLL